MVEVDIFLWVQKDNKNKQKIVGSCSKNSHSFHVPMISYGSKITENDGEPLENSPIKLAGRRNLMSCDV